MTDIFRKEYRELSEDAKNCMALIKDDAERLYDSISLALDADPRMIALAKTNLEQAVMWAIKAIT